ncbi:hypothetical protein GCM10008107_12430 [Psychrosphaera saromensis]|uniref:hypothetical protein n=1 Tax=Psychrosphaera saromensis TaxID=716813 RepID=UPI001679D059|nr:hypothetical protein [Psychrosphaera saromensis]GHB64731.1 hypothetical protein GCM10008107_12430 [Psychrosphaera saromensis]GLQ15746.1 hypothetical protein GCM10007917_32010 [Psychrosphaera saromensis]
MLRRRRTNNLKKVGLMNTSMRRRVANRHKTRRLVHRRIKQIPMSLEGSTINRTENQTTDTTTS